LTATNSRMFFLKWSLYSSRMTLDSILDTPVITIP
jgi:hypothetical protein